MAGGTVAYALFTSVERLVDWSAYLIKNLPRFWRFMESTQAMGRCPVWRFSKMDVVIDLPSFVANSPLCPLIHILRPHQLPTSFQPCVPGPWCLGSKRPLGRGLPTHTLILTAFTCILSSKYLLLLLYSTGACHPVLCQNAFKKTKSLNEQDMNEVFLIGPYC